MGRRRSALPSPPHSPSSPPPQASHSGSTSQHGPPSRLNQHIHVKEKHFIVDLHVLKACVVTCAEAPLAGCAVALSKLAQALPTVLLHSLELRAWVPRLEE